jgi:hypothetical protein
MPGAVLTSAEYSLPAVVAHHVDAAPPFNRGVNACRHNARDLRLCVAFRPGHTYVRVFGDVLAW